MANPEHVEIVKRGAEAIREWRRRNENVRLDLRGADLRGHDLREADLWNADMRGADLSEVDLGWAYMSGCDLAGAILNEAELNGARLGGSVLNEAELKGAYMIGVVLNEALLKGANLTRAVLTGVELMGAELEGANFTNATCGATIFADVDLSSVKGLETVKHQGPSTVGVDTLYLSGGKIPDIFLRGCGVPEGMITNLSSLIGAEEAIQFYSCFISYSSKDEEFAQRLHARMRAANLRVWYAPEDMKGGQKIHEQIDRAIQLHDRLLLVLSDASLQSEWVMTEIRRARRAERKENRRKLFPIRLVPFDTLLDWECFDADSGKDLGVEIREYFVPDFSEWKNHDAFEAAFSRLLTDLRAEEKQAEGAR